MTKIHDDHPTGVINHDVLRLEIPMDDTFAVSSSKREANRRMISTASSAGSLSRFDDQAFQIASRDVLHRDELHAIGFHRYRRSARRFDA